MDIEETVDERTDLVRRITEEVNELVERYGAEHPLLDFLIEQRLEELLRSDQRF